MFLLYCFDPSHCDVRHFAVIGVQDACLVKAFGATHIWLSLIVCFAIDDIYLFFWKWCFLIIVLSGSLLLEVFSPHKTKQECFKILLVELMELKSLVNSRKGLNCRGNLICFYLLSYKVLIAVVAEWCEADCEIVFVSVHFPPCIKVTSNQSFYAVIVCIFADTKKLSINF